MDALKRAFGTYTERRGNLQEQAYIVNMLGTPGKCSIFSLHFWYMYFEAEATTRMTPSQKHAHANVPFFCRVSDPSWNSLKPPKNHQKCNIFAPLHTHPFTPFSAHPARVEGRGLGEKALTLKVVFSDRECMFTQRANTALHATVVGVIGMCSRCPQGK